MVFGAVQAGYLFSPQMLEKLSQLRNSGSFRTLFQHTGMHTQDLGYSSVEMSQTLRDKFRIILVDQALMI